MPIATGHSRNVEIDGGAINRWSIQRRVSALAIVILELLSACSADREGELSYVDRVRNEYRTLSVDVISDARLLELGRKSCSAKGFEDVDRRELTEAGVDPVRLVELAEPLCPAR